MLEEYRAVKARMQADPVLSMRVFESVREDASGLVRDTYVIVTGAGPETVGDDRLAKSQDPDSDATYAYDTRCVAPTADGAIATNRRVARQLIGHRLVVPGRRCDPMRLDDSGRVQVDDSVKPPLFYIDSTFMLTSRRG